MRKERRDGDATTRETVGAVVGFCDVERKGNKGTKRRWRKEMRRGFYRCTEVLREDVRLVFQRKEGRKQVGPLSSSGGLEVLRGSEEDDIPRVEG